MALQASKVINGLIVICPEVKEDYRGSYTAIYNKAEYDHMLGIDFVEHCISYSTKGVLRGIHWDSERWKLCQCVYGRIYHVVVEPISGKWESFILSGDNRIQVLVPPKHGNSYQVLSNEAVFLYYMSEYYDPKREKTFKWNRFDIDWPLIPILSRKDK